MDILSLTLLSVIALFSGFFAGLLGLGGGVMLVPFLTFFMGRNLFPNEYLTHIAIATALATVVFTAIASMRTHYRQGNVDLALALTLIPGMVIGSWVGANLASYMSSNVMSIFFATFLLWPATQVFLDKKPKPGRVIPSKATRFGVTTVIGSISSIVGAGGGALTVPFLVWCNVNMHKAVGTSAVMGLPIALAGTTSYIYYGWGIEGLPSGSLGFIYLPALVPIVLFSMFAARLGAKAASRLAVKTLKKVFSLVLYTLSAYMFFRVF